ncbi:MAG: peptide chain release factor 1 [Candidatus Omnitrophica bacterium]|nr:peptide chain release factor 1 [Candidatus Omnitrophota bacterium]
MTEKLLAKTAEKMKRLAEVETLLHDPDLSKNLDRMKALGKELRELERVKELDERLRRVLQSTDEARQILLNHSDEADLVLMAQAEVEELVREKAVVLKDLEKLLVKRDPLDAKNVVVEIRAGTGGAEASLFASDIFRMYTRFAANEGFKAEILAQAATEAGGLREIIFSVSGDGAHGRFKYESGVHRVQRVPATEASGRIHTSAVTVAVLPEAEDVEVKIDPTHIKVDVFRSGGPGGQSVNTTDSAVRVTHVPTGLVVKCQDEKSQLKNKNKAMKILRARLYDLLRKEQQDVAASNRKSQIGSGDRSEKIRTYNFPERRVTDHRIGLTLHRLESILEGDMGEIVETLASKEREAQDAAGA